MSTSSGTTQLLEQLETLIRGVHSLLAPTDSGAPLELQETLLERGREIKTSAERYLHEHPWQALGVAAAAGLVLGLALAHRGDSDAAGPAHEP